MRCGIFARWMRGGEVLEGGDVAIAFIGAGVLQGADAGTDDCRSGRQ